MVSSAPLVDIIQNREAIGRVTKWAIELGPHGLKYVPYTAIKSQALVDFINDWTELQMPEEKPNNTYWTIHFDESRQLEGSGAGVVLASPRGKQILLCAMVDVSPVLTMQLSMKPYSMVSGWLRR